MSSKKSRVSIQEVESVKPVKSRDGVEVAVINKKPYVTRSGQFKAGDKAIVVRAGSEIGLKHPFFDFIKNKKGVQRVRKTWFRRSLTTPPIGVGKLVEQKDMGIPSNGLALTFTDMDEVVASFGNTVTKNADGSISVKVGESDLLYEKDHVASAYAALLNVKKHVSAESMKLVKEYEGYIDMIKRKIHRLQND